MANTLPRPGKAAVRMKTSELEYTLNNGEELPKLLTKLLEDAVEAAKASDDGDCQVVFFVENDSDDADEPEDA